MNASHNDGLRHAFQSHAKEKESSYFQITWQVYEYLSKGRDLSFLFLFSLSIRRWDCKSSRLLEILNSITDVSILGRLDSSTQDFFWLIFVPKLDLKDQLF